MPLLCDHTLATQQRQVSLIPEEGSLLDSVWSCHQKNQITNILLPGQEVSDPVPPQVLEVPGVRLLAVCQIFLFIVQVCLREKMLNITYVHYIG